MVISLHVDNKITECADGRLVKRNLSKVNKIIVHRIDKLGEDAPEICNRFQTDPDISKYTGKENPYTFYILREDKDGVIQQACPLVEKTAHAKRFNSTGIGIAVVGDFRKHEPTQAQWISLVNLCSMLQMWKPLNIFGHGELAGASSNPNKECPGSYLPMDGLRREVAVVAKFIGERTLMDVGVTF